MALRVASPEDYGGIKVLLDQMEASPDNVLLQEQGCTELSRRTWLQGRYSSDLAGRATLVLFNVLSMPSVRPKALAQACQALGNLARSSDVRRQHISTTGPALVLACMRQHMPEAEVQKHGCHAVANMCADPALRDVVLALGGEEVVALVLSSHAQEPEVTQLAQWALDNLALCTSDEERVKGVVSSPRGGSGEQPGPSASAGPARPAPQAGVSSQVVDGWGGAKAPLPPSGLKVDLRKGHAAPSPKPKAAVPQATAAAASKGHGIEGGLQEQFKAKLKDHELTLEEIVEWTVEDIEELLKEVFQYNVLERNKLKKWLAGLRAVAESLGPAQQSKTSTSKQPDQTAIEQALAPPSEFICSVSGDVMVDPVFTADGHTYDRMAIVEWFRACCDKDHVTSPNTGMKLESMVLVPNHALRSQIVAWREKCMEYDREHHDLIVKYGLEDLVPTEPPAANSGNNTQSPPAPLYRPTLADPRPEPRAPAAPRFTGDLSTCSACSEPLNGPFVRAFGRAFHSRCFKCGLCREVIHDQKYATDNGMPYHAHCIAVQRGEVCAKCRSPIGGTVVRALNLCWHTTCFTCWGCGAAIEDDEFMPHNNRPYHVHCHPTERPRPRPKDARAGRAGRARGSRSSSGPQARPAPGPSVTSNMSNPQLINYLRGQGSNAARLLSNHMQGVRPFRNTVL
uniref:RING-type E3 ubiquitin transferase n=1 Tax=Eutreptiella gymnastica TaxID=73025 RepID=A0A7S4GN72_9EUGL